MSGFVALDRIEYSLLQVRHQNKFGVGFDAQFSRVLTHGFNGRRDAGSHCPVNDQPR